MIEQQTFGQRRTFVARQAGRLLRVSLIVTPRAPSHRRSTTEPPKPTSSSLPSAFPADVAVDPVARRSGRLEARAIVIARTARRRLIRKNNRAVIGLRCRTSSVRWSPVSTRRPARAVVNGTKYVAPESEDQQAAVAGRDGPEETSRRRSTRCAPRCRHRRANATMCRPHRPPAACPQTSERYRRGDTCRGCRAGCPSITQVSPPSRVRRKTP